MYVFLSAFCYDLFLRCYYHFNEETESFIRKKFDMPIPDESKEQ